MLTKKKATVPLLSLLLAATMLIHAPLVSATSEPPSTVDHLENHLVIHYDFEGTNGDEFKDKASGTANKISDDLSLKCAAREADFTVADGIVTSSNDCASVLYADSSTDIKSISTFTDTASDATWFVRYKMNGTSLTESDGFVFDFNHINTYTMMYDLRKDGQVRWRGWATTGNASVEANAGLWNGAGWVNASVTRSYDAATQQYTFTLSAYDDELNSKTVATQVVSKDEVVSYSDVTLAFFGFFNEGPQSGFGFAKELSIDDFRLYNMALTQEQIKNLVKESFILDEDAPVPPVTDDDTDKTTEESNSDTTTPPSVTPDDSPATTDIPATTNAPVITDTPVTTDTPTTTEKPAETTTPDEEKKGCVGSVALLSTVGMLGACLPFVMKRKEEV